MSFAVTTSSAVSIMHLDAYLHFGIVNNFDRDWLNDEIVTKFFDEGLFFLYEDVTHAEFFITYRRQHPDFSVEEVVANTVDTEKDEKNTSDNKDVDTTSTDDGTSTDGDNTSSEETSSTEETDTENVNTEEVEGDTNSESEETTEEEAASPAPKTTTRRKR